MLVVQHFNFDSDALQLIKVKGKIAPMPVCKIANSAHDLRPTLSYSKPPINGAHAYPKVSANV